MELKHIQTAFATANKPFAQLCSGDRSINAKDIADATAAKTALLNDGDNLRQVMAANNVDADLKRNAIMQTSLGAFKRRIVPAAIFCTRFNSVPLEGTNKILVPYYPLDTVASKNFVDGTGYQFDQDSDTEGREVTVSKRKYKPFNYYSHQLSRQPAFSTALLLARKTEQLAIDVWLDILSGVTVANYGASAKAEDASTFDDEDVLELEGEADEADWPDTGRSIVLDTAYHTNLKKSLKDASKSGSDQALREGSTGRVGRFDVFHSPRIPANGEHLKGFICLPEAMLVAVSPIMPGPGVRRNLLSYDLVTDPDLGVGFEYRHWGSADQDEEREVVEVNYNFEKGNEAALKRITDQ